MLLGRDSEQRRLDRLVSDARAGTSGVLALVGEVGIGKTALLDAVAGRAAAMRVLRARGVESEAAVPFSGLLELLRPALGELAQIPRPQAAALGGALALRPGSGGDRFAVGAATLSLLAAQAEIAPTLVLVDDAHWLDDSSADALRFALRRLLADPIAVVLAVRAGEPSLLDGSDLPVLTLGGLDRAAAGALLARRATPPGVDRLHAATAGNPLALLELAARDDDIAAVGPAPLPERLAEAFGGRVDSLPAGTREALLVAAAGDDGDLAVLARAGAPPDALAVAEAAGLVRLGAGRVEFHHPLVRSAVYARADPGARRAAHRALAAALPDRDADRRAWHLAAAAVGPDEGAAAALTQAATRAGARRAHAVAAAAFERAARLSADDARRADLLLRGAEEASLAGAQDRAATLAAEVEALVPDTRSAVRAAYLRGEVVARRGPLPRALATLADAAARAEAMDEAELAVDVHCESVSAGYYAADARAMGAAADRVAALLGDVPGDRPTFLAHSALGMARIWAGRVEEGTTALRTAVATLERAPELRDDPSLQSWTLIAPLWLRDAASGRELADAMLVAARDQAALGSLPHLLFLVARDHATSDRWSQAAVGYDESAGIARELRQTRDLAAALAGLAWLEARQGRADACRAHAQEALGLCAQLGGRTHELWSLWALGELELALGNPARALGHLVQVRELLDALELEDADLSPGPELVELHLRLGDPDAAAGALAAFAVEAERKARPWSLARLARARGLTAADSELDERFGEALRLHGETPDGYETARTRLAYGARLRRARRRVDAREQLGLALRHFEDLGASPWADAAGAELAATGVAARRRDPSTLDDLTPQELHIAQLLAEGRTTRETAAAVFLSPKTVEYHLRSIYRKLGIHDREALAAALAADE